MSKKVNEDWAYSFAARLHNGSTIYPEDAKAFAEALGLDPDKVKAQAATPDKVMEYEDANTRQWKERLEVPKSKVVAEEAANKALENDRTVDLPEPKGTGSNDPDVNPAATGQEPFSNDKGIGSSGQVIDAGEYKDDKKEKAAASK